MTKPSPPVRSAHRPWLGWYKTAEWRAKAKRQLQAEPWCRYHAQRGERVPGRIADHITPHRGDPARFWGGALQTLCKSCHSGLKQSLEAGKREPCGPDGLPTRSGHPWAE